MPRKTKEYIPPNQSIEEMCQEVAGYHNLTENQLDEMIERACIVKTENNWSQSQSVAFALQCVKGKL